MVDDRGGYCTQSQRHRHAHGCHGAADYGQGPVTCNTCNIGGFLRFLLLQVVMVTSKTRRYSVSRWESHAFFELFSRFRGVSGLAIVQQRRDRASARVQGGVGVSDAEHCRAFD